jgi:glycosyltransferase involved in cell wall biosynthesis
VTAPDSRDQSLEQSPARVTRGQVRAADARQPGDSILLDLSGDERAAREWMGRLFPGCLFTIINKADLKWGSKREALRRLRALGPKRFVIFTSDIDQQSARAAMWLFAAASGARQVAMGDKQGRTASRSRFNALALEAPRLAVELIFGYALVVPLSFFLTLLLYLSLRFRSVVRASRIKSGSRAYGLESRAALYIKATLSSATEGGMATHVAGFAGGARSAGHRLIFLTSGGAQREDAATIPIKPSAAFGASRALFELWNNFAFTAKSISRIAGDARGAEELDFIYQRYSRFNWTGVALSILTGLPFALEFNGSEVWTSKRWDPVGQVWLLKLFERLNLRAADMIFTVSEVQRRDLIESGHDQARVFANPNGVDIEEFRPDRGGAEVRDSLGLADRVLVGFIGTFGPWHGSPVLAKAVTKITEDARCHFLFIGDGDQRAKTEAIIAESGRSHLATFTGRVPHTRVPAYLDACDILVCPHIASPDGSEFFGSPTKLFEYMAVARPVVASRLGQIADVIVDGENGLLVEPGNADDLARAISRLASDRALRARLGAAARRTVVENYTWRQNAARVFDAARRRIL